jgi:hypothetical protein
MSNHFSMGAINKNTNKYEYPRIADKNNKYKCPNCDKNVIFRKGKIKQPHFAHYKSVKPCSYYEKPNEKQIHKDAKLLMKTLLDNKNKILFYRECYQCLFEENTIFEYKISDNDYNENTIASMEYRFNYNNSSRSADVALVENKNIKYIFEICYKNKTKEENRPEPWFEINSEKLINNINSVKNINNEIRIECIREYKCEYCKEVIEHERTRQKEQLSEKNELLNMSKEDERANQIQKIIEFEKEIERIKQNKIIEREKENITRILEQNKRCDICNINYCKCDKPNFIKNDYNKIKCISCEKHKCMCMRITDFFKK